MGTLERGEANVSLSNIHKTARALGIIGQISHASEKWLLQIWHDGQGWCHVVMQPGSAPGDVG
jgi:hypothetical protein